MICKKTPHIIPGNFHHSQSKSQINLNYSKTRLLPYHPQLHQAAFDSHHSTTLSDLCQSDEPLYIQSERTRFEHLGIVQANDPRR